MFGKSLVSASLIALGVAMVPGNGLANTLTPAELPPSSFTGSQYVDSKGCVFVRAGSGGMTQWIPRMDRGRSHICNAQPTAVARAPEAAPAAPTAAASTGLIRSASPSLRAAATVAPTVPVTTGFQPSSSTSGVRYVTAPPANVRVVSPSAFAAAAAQAGSAPARAATPVPSTTTVASACPGASPLSRQYINHGQHGPVRCGPQPVHPMDVYRPQGAAPTPRSTGAPSYAFGARPPFEPVNARPQTPEGYRVAWGDGRLNPNRGPGAVAVAQATTPYQATVSTRSAPAATQAPARAATAPREDGRIAVSVGVGHRFVQVGTYREAANSARAIRVLQGLGLPVAKSRVRIGGQPAEMVLAGPFSDTTQLATALHRARQAGFSDAVTRR